jgi:hypothetical protein
MPVEKIGPESVFRKVCWVIDVIFADLFVTRNGIGECGLRGIFMSLGEVGKRIIAKRTRVRLWYYLLREARSAACYMLTNWQSVVLEFCNLLRNEMPP